MKEIRYYIKKINDFPIHLNNEEPIVVRALWFDLFLQIKKEILKPQILDALNWQEIQKSKDLTGIHLILIHLIANEDWKAEELEISNIFTYCKQTLPFLSATVHPYTEWIRDPERSEELVRSFFHHLKFIPEGETEAYFLDRWKSIDSLERMKIIDESKKAQERAKEILRKIKEAEEAEAASKYNRE